MESSTLVGQSQLLKLLVFLPKAQPREELEEALSQRSISATESKRNTREFLIDSVVFGA